MKLNDIDLNLLVVFQQLVVERRVNAVAQSLGITQPAVSNALRRLRRHLGDELFLRTSTGMEPTPFAARLVERVNNIALQYAPRGWSGRSPRRWARSTARSTSAPRSIRRPARAPSRSR